MLKGVLKASDGLSTLLTRIFTVEGSILGLDLKCVWHTNGIEERSGDSCWSGQRSLASAVLSSESACSLPGTAASFLFY